jgi:membrane protease YdiL (CAAX protease family)
VSLGTSFVEAFVFYGLVPHLGREALGDRLSVLYIALLFTGMQLGHLSWPSSLFTFALNGLFYGWVVPKTHTIYTVSLAHGFMKIFFWP